MDCALSNVNAGISVAVAFMDKFQLAKILYLEGYEHREVRAIWAYAWNEKNIGATGKRKKPWQLKALEKVSVSVEEIEFEPTDSGDLGSYT